jgi:hypothetical protein
MNTLNTVSNVEIPARDGFDQAIENWSADAPRGGKTVMNRMIKEKATVPLFFAQTLIQSLRDVGYNQGYRDPRFLPSGRQERRVQNGRRCL